MKVKSFCGHSLYFFSHNEKRFSKFAFGFGKYKDENMTELDITKIRDFATFMALTSNNQGTGGEVPLKKFKDTVVGDKVNVTNDKIWSAHCKSLE